jgi:hypothetical protein
MYNNTYMPSITLVTLLCVLKSYWHVKSKHAENSSALSGLAQHSVAVMAMQLPATADVVLLGSS